MTIDFLRDHLLRCHDKSASFVLSHAPRSSHRKSRFGVTPSA